MIYLAILCVLLTSCGGVKEKRIDSKEEDAIVDGFNPYVLEWEIKNIDLEKDRSINSAFLLLSPKEEIEELSKKMKNLDLQANKGDEYVQAFINGDLKFVEIYDEGIVVWLKEKEEELKEIREVKVSYRKSGLEKYDESKELFDKKIGPIKVLDPSVQIVIDNGNNRILKELDRYIDSSSIKTYSVDKGARVKIVVGDRFVGKYQLSILPILSNGVGEARSDGVLELTFGGDILEVNKFFNDESKFLVTLTLSRKRTSSDMNDGDLEYTFRCEIK